MAAVFLGSLGPVIAQNVAVTTRHAPSINGNSRVEGSVQQLLGESVTLNGGATLTQDLLVPGTPTVQTSGSVNWQGVRTGTGSDSPTGYTARFNGNVTLRYLRTQTNATTIPSVPTPPAATGTRAVVITHAGQSAGDWGTVRDLTLNGNAGQIAVPAGTYRHFTANGGSGFTLGVAGAAQPAIYSFQSLTLNGQTTINVIGPVILQLANGLNANGQVGVTSHPEWLQIRISNGGVALHGGSAICGSILAPNGQVIVNGHSTLVGTAMCDRFTLNGGGLVKWANTSAGSGNQPPIAAGQSVSTPEDVEKSITLGATDADGNSLTFSVVSQPSHGAVSGSGASVTYTPFPNYFGPDSFTFAANDGTMNSQPATVSIVVTSVNDAPFAQAQAVSATEDAPVVIGLMATDVDGDALTYDVTTPPAYGTLSGTAPNLTYTPAPNFHGPDAFVFRVNDGQLNSALATVTINVAPLEDVPVVGPLDLHTPEDEWVNITLAGLDADGEPLVFHVASAPLHGVLTGTLPNLVYTPSADYSGSDSFTYYASDSAANSAVATVSITIAPVNDPPQAESLTDVLNEDTAAAFALPARDADGDTLTWQITALPAHGTVSGVAPNLLYTPAANFFGTDSLTFVARDATSASAPAVISFTVRADNDEPVANPQAVALNEDAPATVLLTATEVDGDPVQFAVLTGPQHGTLMATANPAAFIYTPAGNYHGSDSFTFKANDGAVDSAPATVTLAVAPVRDVPVAPGLAFSTPEDQSATVTLTGLDYDGYDLAFVVVTPPAHGTLAGNGAELAYTPAANYHGPDSFSYIAQDPFGDSLPAQVAITVTPVNDAPVAIAFTPNVMEDTGADLMLAAGDQENDALTYRIVTQPAHGTLTLGSNGAVVHYAPAPNYHGPDGFAFVANDGQLDSAPATVAIAVVPTNDAPVARATAFSTHEDQSVAIVLQADDVDGDALTFLPTAPAHGSLTLGPLPGTYLYTPEANYHGPDAITFTVSDGLASSAPAAVGIEVTPVNDPPVIQVTPLGQITAPTAINLHAVITDDQDPAGQSVTVTWSKVSGPGAVAFANPAAASTMATYDRAGTYILRVTVTDGETSVTADVTALVEIPNQPPAVSAGTAQTVALATPVNLLGVIQDDGLPQGGTITQHWSKLSGPGAITFGNATALATTATFDAAGDYVLRLRVSDSILSGQAEVTIHVLAPNQRPQVHAGPAQNIVLGTAATLTGSVTDDGLPRGAGLQTQWSKVNGPGAVSFSDPYSAGCTAQFTAAGLYVLRLSASDTDLTGSAEVQVTVSVPENVAPVVNAGPDLQEVEGFALLQGRASDDGLPGNGGLVLTWTKVSGPGSVVFADAQSATSGVTFNAAGTYVLRFSATDGELTASDELTAVVTTRNQPPVVSAGPDFSVATDQPVMLAGSVQDDGLPTGQQVTGMWGVVSGPGVVTFGEATAVRTPAVFSAVGTYVLRLTVSDSAATVQDEVIAEVSASTGVQITCPTPATVAYAPATLSVRAAVEGVLPASVEFLKDGQSLGQATVSPYEVRWTAAQPGTFDLVAIASFPDGSQKISTPVVIRVLPGVENLAGFRVEMPVTTAIQAHFGLSQPVSSGTVIASQIASGPMNVAVRLRGLVQPKTITGGEDRDGLWIKGGTLANEGADVWSLVVSDPPQTYYLNSNVSLARNPELPVNTSMFRLDLTKMIQINPGARIILTSVSGDGASALNNAGYVIPGVEPAPKPNRWEFVQIDPVSAGLPTSTATLAANAGPDQNVTWPDLVTLSGAATAMGASHCAPRDVYWSQVSGWGLAKFAAPHSPTTNVTFSRPGTYRLRLIATAEGQVAQDEVTITVLPGSSNLAPIVQAGSDLIATAGRPIELAGQVIDDGLPVSTPVVAWNRAAPGPGEVFFENAQAATTKVTFSAPGAYALQLAADDGALAAADTVNVTVQPATTTFPPDLAGYWSAEGSAVDGVHGIFGELQPGVSFVPGVRGQAFRFQGGDTGVKMPFSAAFPRYDVGAGEAMTVEFWVKPDRPAEISALIDWNGVGHPGTHLWLSYPNGNAALWSGLLTRSFGFAALGTNANALTANWQHVAWVWIKSTGTARLYVDGVEIASAPLGIAGQGISTNTDLWFGRRVAYGPFEDFSGCMDEIKLWRRALSPAEIASRAQPPQNQPNQPPTVDAGSLSGLILAGQSIALTGTASDDGLPAASLLVSEWRKASGPGNVAFSNPGGLNTTVTFDQPGLYLLRLGATDSEYSVWDEIPVYVGASGGGNQPPQVNLGPDQTVTFGQTAAVAPQVDDDGLPSGSVALSYLQTAGARPLSAVPNGLGGYAVSFPAVGAYTLRLTAYDGQFSTSDEVTFTVTPAASAAPAVQLTAPVGGSSFPRGQVLDLRATASDPDTGGGIVSVAFYDGATLIGTDSAPDATGHARLVWTGAPTGSHALTAVATDYSGTTAVSAPINITITPARPVVALSYPLAYTAFAPGDTLQVQATASPGGDGSAVTQVEFLVNGSVVGVDPGAPYAVGWTAPAVPGDYTLIARCTDAAGQTATSPPVLVRVVTDPFAPTIIELIGPADGAKITSPTVITGRVEGPSVASWRLESRRRSAPELGWKTFAQGSGMVAEGELGTFDPTQTLNGIYDLRLVATHAGGGQSYVEGNVVVEGDMKIGAFVTSVTDLSVALPGLPIEVRRVYDSDDGKQGDFGPGWCLDLNLVRLEKNFRLGEAWEQTVDPPDAVTNPQFGVIPRYSIDDVGPHVIAIVFPDGRVARFRTVVKFNGQSASRLAAPWRFFNGFTMGFEPLPGTQGRLEAAGVPALIYPSDDSVGSVLWADGNIVDDFNANFWEDATGFTYTTLDGTRFTFDAQGKLTQQRDRHGNTLTVGPNGIVHSSGRSVAIQRDGQGRITTITDPRGSEMRYFYDQFGKLARFTDRLGNATQYGYEASGKLASVKDPFNVEQLRLQYDSERRLRRTYDVFNQPLAFLHNVEGRTETVTDALGHTTTVQYSSSGQVLRKTDALGGASAFTYDARGNRTSMTDAAGNVQALAFNEFDLPATITDPEGNVFQYGYRADGKPETLTDALGNIVTLGYDASGNVASVTDALGNTTTFAYNAKGQITAKTDALGHTSTFAYNAEGRMTRMANAPGHAVVMTYDANGNELTRTTTRTKSDGTVETLTTTQVYDAADRLVETTDALGRTFAMAYDAAGRKVSDTDAAGRVTTYEYDAQGRVTRTVAPDGTATGSTYDVLGRVATSLDAAGRATAYAYDELGRLTRTTFADGTFVETSYDAVGRVLTSTDAAGRVTSYAYDRAGRRTGVTDALGQTTAFTYDANGNLATTTDALGRVTSSIYDALNRRVQTVFADGTTASTGYDELGRVTAETDQAGRTKNYAYDILGRLLGVTDALNQTTAFTYDEMGNTLMQVDALSRITRYGYDGLGRRVRRTLPLGMVEALAYDASGNLSARTDFKGRTTTYQYDAGNRLIAKVPDAALGEPGVAYTYTETGRRAAMADASGTTNYSYDLRDRLVSKATPQGTLSYRYDAAGQLIRTQSEAIDGLDVSYGYDGLGRLGTVTDRELGATSYSYDAVGNLSSFRTPNAVTHGYGYDSLNRLTQMLVSSAPATGPPGILASYNYALSLTGRRNGVQESGSGILPGNPTNTRTVAYLYDALDRLTRETVVAAVGPAGQTNYTYDAVGNRLTRASTVPGVTPQSFSYDTNDRLTSDSYDANGNTTLGRVTQPVVSQVPIPVPPETTVSDSYDYEDRLKSRNGGGLNVSVLYNGDGQRVAETVNGQTVTYLVDDLNLTGYAQVVEERTNGTVTRTYTYGHDLLAQDTRDGSGTWHASYFGYDGHGSVRFLTNTLGTVTDTYTYDAYGTLLASTGTTANRYRYAGEEFDPGLGLYHLRARYLNAANGRFWNADTYEGQSTDPQSLHRYNYAYGNPANLNDPSGHSPTLAGTMIQIAQSLYFAELAGDEAQSNAVMWYRQNNPGAGAEEIARVGRLAYGMAFSTTLTDGVLDLLPGYAIGRAYYELGGSWDRFTDPQVDRNERAQAGISFLQNAASIGIQVGSYASLFREPGPKLAQVSAATPPTATNTPSDFARSLQGSGAYPGVDRWRDITLKKGTIIYGGDPGQSAFYTTGSAIGRTGDSATDIFQGLQVAAHPVHGYRPAMTAYEVTADVPAAFGRSLANPQHGAGRLPQIVLPNYKDFLRPIHTAPLSP